MNIQPRVGTISKDELATLMENLGLEASKVRKKSFLYII